MFREARYLPPHAFISSNCNNTRTLLSHPDAEFTIEMADAVQQLFAAATEAAGDISTQQRG